MNNRIYQMAENVLWQLKSQESFVGITKRKMIIWTHNFHGSKNMVKSWPYATYQQGQCHGKSEPCGVVPAMDRVKFNLGTKSFSMGAMSYSGTIGYNYCPPSSDTPDSIFAPVGSFEFNMNLAGYSNAAFIDFTSSPVPSWISDGISLGYDNYVVNQGNFADAFESALFFNQMNPITCL
jgi:erythromycin esterase-like protein